MRVDTLAVICPFARCAGRQICRGNLALIFAATKQGLEETAWPRRLLKRRALLTATAIGVKPRDEITAATPATRGLELAEVGLHLRDARIERAALRRCRAAKEEELLPIASQLMGVSSGSGEFCALFVCCASGTIVSTTGRRNLLLEAAAIDRLSV